jgi:hypothetical protein
MASSPESGPSESGAGTAKPSWGSVSPSTAQALGAAAVGGYSASQAATSAAIGSTAVGAAAK